MKKFKIFRLLSVVVLLICLFGCKTPTDVDFSYSPLNPRIGQTITFTNTTTNGSKFDWRFGDATASTTKNPTHIYKKPGVYTVTLRVDSSNNYMRSKEITVFDSIPVITTSDSTVNVFTNFTVGVLAYNPNDLPVTYEWTFSENAKGDAIVNMKSTADSVILFFNKKNVTELVKLKITIGTEVFNVTSSIYVNDLKASSLLMAKKDGNLLQQRLFANGSEEPIDLGISAGKHPYNLAYTYPYVYIFDAGSVPFTGTAVPGDGTIRKIDVTNNQVSEIIKNTSSNENNFYNGWADNNYIYWTDYTQFVYKAPIATVGETFSWAGNSDSQTNNKFYLVKSDRLGYFGNGLSNNDFSGGIYNYDNTYFWAKKGIFRFKSTDILSANVTGAGVSPATGAILTDYYINAFAIDRIHQKIYFAVYSPSDKTGLWVANLDGTSATRIDDAPITSADQYITGIAIDNELNNVYWAYRGSENLGNDYYALHPTHRTGVKRMGLLTFNSKPGPIDYLLNDIPVYGIAISYYKILR